jgi:hypothetical protein
MADVGSNRREIIDADQGAGWRCGSSRSVRACGVPDDHEKGPDSDPSCDVQCFVRVPGRLSNEINELTLTKP